MGSKEKFKEFVKTNPTLIKYVKDGSMTWQKFYEMYDLYGEDKEVWKNYITTASAVSSFDILNWLKNIDIDTVQENINSVKRVIGVLQDLGTSKTDSTSYPSATSIRIQDIIRTFSGELLLFRSRFWPLRSG